MTQGVEGDDRCFTLLLRLVMETSKHLGVNTRGPAGSTALGCRQLALVQPENESMRRLPATENAALGFYRVRNFEDKWFIHRWLLMLGKNPAK